MTRWYKSLAEPNGDAEELVVRPAGSSARLAVRMAERGFGDGASYAIDPVFDAARASRDVKYHELRSDCAHWLSQVGLTAEAGALRSTSGEVAAEAARMIRESIPAEIPSLIDAIRVRGEFLRFDDKVKDKFIGRLRTR